MAPPTLSTANSCPRWLANLGRFFSVASFSCSLWEWFSVGIIQDAKKIADYNFGSGSMLKKGGPHYASAELYAHAMLISAIFGIPSIFAFCLAIKRKTGTVTLLAYANWIGFALVSSFV